MAGEPTMISIDAFPLAGQHSAWREALGELSLGFRLPEGASPSGDIGITRSKSGAVLARLRSSAQQIDNGCKLPDPRRSAPWLVVFHCHGRGGYRGRQICEFAAGDVSVCDRADPFSLDLRDDFDILMLEIPRERLLARLGRAPMHLPSVLGSTVAAGAVRPVMRTLALHFEQLSLADLGSAEIAVTELIAGALLGEAKLTDGGTTQVQAASFRRVAAIVETRLADPDLSISAIAAHEAISQRYLQKLFELQDTTFTDYVRQRRLDRARLDLADPRHASEGIADIAFRWGFRDPAHFSRVFSAAYGVSPRAFRNAPDPEPKMYPRRGRPLEKTVAHSPVVAPHGAAGRVGEICKRAGASPPPASNRHHIKVSKDTVHWGYLGRAIPPVMRVPSGAEIVMETLTQHAYDDHARMIAGDAGAESVFAWTAEGKNVERRGAGPMNASIFGRGAGEGFGVHIFTGPVYINEAEPGDVLEVQILDIAPRPSANPDFAPRCFASNASAWWGYQYSDLLDEPKKREVITIYEVEPGGSFARAVYSYRWAPQVDPFGVRHDTMDYPGVPVDHSNVEELHGIMPNVRLPLRPHFGCMAVAPRESDLIDSIPPGYFGGNIDNWRAGKGTSLYLPVAVPGALFSVGDGHLAQGDGEINGTGLEASLTGTFRLIVHKKGAETRPHLRGLNAPLLETPQEFVLHGFSYPNYLRELGRNAQAEVYQRSSLSKALRSAFRGTRKFLMQTWGLTEDEAISLISIGVDFGVTQVADGNWGVHAVIRKCMFDAATPPCLSTAGRTRDRSEPQ